MKKKIIAIILIILIVVAGIIFIKNKTNKSNIEYNIANIELYNYVKYKDGEKFGIIDRSGNKIIEAKYSNIEIPNPEKDIFLCYENNNEKPIVLNSSEEVLFEKYDKIEAIKIKNIASTLCYEKSVLKYQKDGLYGLINLSEKEITKNIYTSIENLQGTEGKFQVEENQKFGIINQNGLKLVDCKYDMVSTDGYYDNETKYVESGFIVSNTTNDGYRYGYFDYQGRKILDVQYNELVRISDKKEIYLIVAKDGKFGLYKGNKELLKEEYQSISYTDNGAIIIERNGNYGIANLNGEIKVEPKYTSFEDKGIYLYMQTARENDVYDAEGKKIDINFNKSIFSTENDNYKIITILNNDITYYGVEDKSGKNLIDSKYIYIEYICDDYFIVQDEKEKYGVINSNGDEKIELKYDLIQKIKDKKIIQAQKIDSKKTEIYSSKMELALKMKNAKIQNQEQYVKVYNDKENMFLDNNGNVIQEDSEIVQKELQAELPDNIGQYKKIQYSLEDAYYEK